MFKIGNSKELPAIPDHLSDEGKDFVRQCLQRNPLHRPTAAKLLDHPFVKNAAPLERPILSPETSDPPPGVTNGVKSLVVYMFLLSLSLFSTFLITYSNFPNLIDLYGEISKLYHSLIFYTSLCMNNFDNHLH